MTDREDRRPKATTRQARSLRRASGSSTEERIGPTAPSAREPKSSTPTRPLPGRTTSGAGAVSPRQETWLRRTRPASRHAARNRGGGTCEEASARDQSVRQTRGRRRAQERRTASPVTRATFRSATPHSTMQREFITQSQLHPRGSHNHLWACASS